MAWTFSLGATPMPGIHPRLAPALLQWPVAVERRSAETRVVRKIAITRLLPSWLLLLSCFVLGAACERNEEPPETNLALSSATGVPDLHGLLDEGRPLASPRAPEVPGEQKLNLPDASTEAFDFLPPDPPDQLLACDDRGFVQLGYDRMRAFRTLDFKILADVAIDEPRAVAALAGNSYLIVARAGVHRYYHGQKRPRGFAKVPLLGPSQLLPHPEDIQRFYLRYARGNALHLFDLSDKDPEPISDEQLDLVPRPLGLQLGKPIELAGFDQRAFTLLRNGDPLYSAATGLVRLSNQPQPLAPPKLDGRLTQLAAADRLDRYWAFNERGQGVQMELSRGDPIRQRIDLGGLPYAVEVQGRVTAAVVLTLSGGESSHRVWKLKVMEKGKPLAEWSLPDRAGHRGSWVQRVLGNRDLCLFPHKPWVLLGGRDSLTIYDYRRRQTLLHQTQR